MSYIDPLTGRAIDPSRIFDPASSPYFAPQDAGDGSLSAGDGQGYGWLDWTRIPGMEQFASDPASGVSGGGTPRALLSQLTGQGLRLYEQPGDDRWVTRGVVDAQGNFVGDPQTMQMSSDRGFWNAAMLAAAVAGNAAAGAGGGGAAAGEVGAGEAAGGAIGSGVGGAAPTTGGLIGGAAGEIVQGGAAAGEAIGGSTGSSGAAPGGGYFDSFRDWMRANPEAGRALFGLGSGLLTQVGGSNGGGYQDSGYRPTISRGGWSASAQPQAQQPRSQMLGTSLLGNVSGQANDGLWRYRGLLGGAK